MTSDARVAYRPPRGSGSDSSKIERQWLTAREGTRVRESVVTPKGGAGTWENAVDAFVDYVWRQWTAANTWTDERSIRPTSHRFTEKATLDRYARTLGADRAARRLWGDALTTVHVVRRARAFGRDGNPQPAADHLADLLDGNGNVYRAYERHIAENHGLTYARLSVLEPHQNGYPHVHDALWIDDPLNVVDEIDIEPVRDAHLRAVEQAQQKSHGTDSISVEHDPETRSFSGDPDGVPATTALPREVTEYLGGFAPDDGERNPEVPPVLHADRGPLRFYALLWTRGVRQWRPDRRVFPRLVAASQGWYDDEAETHTEPADVDVDHSDSDGVPMVDVSGRAVDFEPIDAD
jgi:hypothetical protein